MQVLYDELKKIFYILNNFRALMVDVLKIDCILSGVYQNILFGVSDYG